MNIRERIADWISGGALSEARSLESHWSAQAEAMVEKLSEARGEAKRQKTALQSIAANTCCEGCGEAARVAREALQ